MSALPTNHVGILALETFFPSVYVKQEDLEVAYGVSKGKYTLGLGQDSLAFVGDNEDINSIALTVVQNLLDKYDISPSEIGRLEIGTESLIDKSKSTKTVLMRLFAESGNVDVEGTTVVNACYGGTAALLNALNWADSSAWDGRFAIVVAADIAVYAAGPARPTGGCGAVAMLVGRNAPLQIDLHTRAMHSSDTWDFFKPNLHSEYPVVNGTNSQTCYLTALDDCYHSFLLKNKVRRGATVTVENTDYFLFHSPYNKLVQKGIGRLLYLDMVSGSRDNSSIAKWLDKSPRDTYEDKELEAALKNVSADAYKQKLSLPCEISRVLGNTYTASVYLNLCYLVSSLGSSLTGKSVVLFSYGSGALASMFRVTPTNEGVDGRFTLDRMQSTLDLQTRLSRREKGTPEDMNVALKAREDAHDAQLPFKPSFGTEKLQPGTFYLEEIKSTYERIYRRK